MSQRLRDWYRYLEQQMHVSLPDDPSRETDVRGHAPGRAGSVRGILSSRSPEVGVLAEPGGAAVHSPVRPSARPFRDVAAAVGARAVQGVPRSPDPRRRGGRRPITETREEIVRRLLDPELTLHEAAAVLNLSKATVRRYTDHGKLVCLRTSGGQRRFRLSTLLAFLDRQGSRGDE